MISPFSLAFGHCKAGSRETLGLVRDHRREEGVPSVALELKWLRLGQVAIAGNTGSSPSVEILHPALIMALSLLGLS